MDIECFRLIYLDFILKTSFAVVLLHIFEYQAGEAFDSVVTRLEESKGDFATAKKKAEEAARAFHKIQTERTNRFIDAFTAIDNSLKTIYKDMTKSRYATLHV